MRRVIPFLVLACFTIFSVAFSPLSPCGRGAGGEGEQKKKQEKGQLFPPTEDVLKQIETKTQQLAAKIDELRKNPKTHKLLPDVEIFLRGAQNIVRFKEWYNKASGQWTLDALDRGLERAERLAEGAAPWTELGKQNVVRGYRSGIDGTAQLYGVTYPAGYGKDVNRKWRIDIVLHGRDGTLTEVKYLNTHNGSKKVAFDQDWVQIDVFGRGNNAYRWAGEADVGEALDSFLINEGRAGRARLPDHHRFVVRGFSMGGAGTWHIGLHHPSLLCVMGPGAGFTTTHDYAWKGKKDLPDYQERCLRIYDAIDYVENARMIPIVAYSGGEDAQKRAADNIENRLKELKINTMTHIVAPGLGHTFPPDWVKKANALWSRHASERPEADPTKVSFVTFTTKYNQCYWVILEGLEKHYDKASVRAEIVNKVIHAETKNVRAIRFQAVRGERQENFTIDGQQFRGVQDPYFVKEAGKWINKDHAARQKNTRLEKVRNLQGPIDDAFASSDSGFVCVTGTGETWHPATQKFVDAKVKAFTYDWAKHWRGELPITNEYGVSPNEIKDKHLILFGDPSSNFLLANILPKLPLKWTKDEIEFAGKKYKSSEHVPVMIFPNPLNPSKYVVLNTGHTIPSEDYMKTNAMLFPRLGDYAILRMTPTAKNAAEYEVATAGLFDEFWKVEKR